MKTCVQHFRSISAACATLLFLVGGCTSTRTWEIDTSSVRDFQWDGRIRITEQTTTEIGPLLTSQKYTAAYSFELVGRDGRNIVVRPSGHAASEHPIARIECAGEANRPVLQLLAMSLKPSYPTLARAVQTVADSQPSPPEQSADEAHRTNDEIARLIRTNQELREGRFDQLTTADAVAAAAAMNQGSYSVFDLGDGKSLKAWLDNTSPPSLLATVYDRDGKVLHEYRPVDLAVHEKPAPP
jgi:hypothetical protein